MAFHLVLPSVADKPNVPFGFIDKKAWASGDEFANPKNKMSKKSTAADRLSLSSASGH